MADQKTAFATLLEQTVTASRLSGSKVAELITQSQKLTSQNLDTEVVTTFYRINSGLPPASVGRISSLYVFDGIARAARKDADKEREKGKAREGKGMTGLIVKMEGVVDAWVGGMVDDGKGGVWVEGKDKMRKILDIWRKGATFPPSTLDRLQSRLIASEAGPSRQQPAANASRGYGGPSTTPPGTPPAPAFSPVLPPLELPSMSKTNSNNSTVPPPATASTSTSTNPANQNLPPEILKLLGIQNASPSPSAPPPQAAVGIDIATLLASVRPPSSATPSTALSYAQQNQYAAASPPVAPLGGLPFALDPAQLAALASFVPPPVTHTPPQGAYALPGQLPGNGNLYPAHNQQYPPYPPQNQYGNDGYGNEGRGLLPRRESDGRSNGYGGMTSDQRYDDRGPRDGYRRDNDRPPPPGQGRGGRERDEGRSFDRSGPGGGRDAGWGDRAQRNGLGRQRSRSPHTDQGYRDRSRNGGRGDDGYGGGRGGGGGGGESGGRRGGHKRGRSSLDKRDGGGFGNGNGHGNDRPIVKPNYGGFKNKPGRFDPPPPPTTAPAPIPVPQQSPVQPINQGRAPLPPGRDRAPLPEGRDMDDTPLNNHSISVSVPTEATPVETPQPKMPSFAQPNRNDSAPTDPIPNIASGSEFGPRLETFDVTSFNPMMPECWSALAEAWKGTTGRDAGQMELMGFLAGQGPVMPMMGETGMQGGNGGQYQQNGDTGMGGGNDMNMGMNGGMTMGSDMENMGHMGQMGNMGGNGY